MRPKILLHPGESRDSIVDCITSAELQFDDALSSGGFNPFFNMRCPGITSLLQNSRITKPNCINPFIVERNFLFRTSMALNRDNNSCPSQPKYVWIPFTLATFLECLGTTAHGMEINNYTDRNTLLSSEGIPRHWAHAAGIHSFIHSFFRSPSNIHPKYLTLFSPDIYSSIRWTDCVEVYRQLCHP